MRIDSIYIEEFKNLRNFTADFDESQPRTVIIGRNGTGKTNLLVALTQIFRDLDLREAPAFGFRLRYRCNGHCIAITSKRESVKGGRFRTSYSIGRGDVWRDEDLSSVSEKEFYELNEITRILPNNIFGYYSGTSNRLTELFRKHEERHRDVLIHQGDQQSLRYLFLAKPEHSQFVLLSFFARADERVRRFLREQFGITGLDCALFVLREPYWSGTVMSEERMRAGDARFWFAGGKVKELLSALHEQSLAPARLKQKVRFGVKRSRRLEHVYCFLHDEASVRALAQGIDQKELFRRLESTQLSDLLGRLDIYCLANLAREPLRFDDLSEGEQQLLTVLGLLRFTDQDESLFLLDEPDTHLNPAWCLDYLQILHDYGSDLQRSQLIMTTHSPIVFAGLTKSEVLVMRKDENGVITAEHPSSDPRGKGFAAILTGDELFGLRSTLDRETLDAMEEKRKLSLVDRRAADQEERLQELNRQLRIIEYSASTADPLFNDFVVAMRSALPERLQAPVLTEEERNERRELASRVLKGLRKKS